MAGKLAKSFEELNVYQLARNLTNEVYRISRQGPFAKDFGLSDQVRRASVSILSNIAEGFERGTRPEFIRFLYIAKGSCGEIRAQLEIARDQKYIPDADHIRLKTQARDISGKISNLIAHLKVSKVKASQKT